MTRSYRDTGCEVISALMWGPKTWAEVEEYAGLGGATSEGWLKSLRAAGLIRISSWRRSPVGRPSRIFSLQKAPFAEPDAPYNAELAEVAA